MTFSSILSSLQQQFQGAWTAINGFVTQGAQDVGNAVSGAFTDAKDLAITGIDQLSSSLATLSAWTTNQLAAAFDQIAELTQQFESWFGLTSERARQYLLARLAKNPLGVMLEGASVVYNAGGAPSFPDPNPGAPWAGFTGDAAERAAAWVNPAHPVRQVIAEALADRAAVLAGKPPTLDPIPTDPATLTGGTLPPAPPGGDPNARGLLTSDDLSYVDQTTA